jgi:hypothetical protein
MKFKILAVFFMLIIVFFIGCSITENVNTKSVKELKKDINAYSDSVQNIKVTFTRPGLDIYITMRETPGEEELNNIVQKIKDFTNEANMKEIAEKVGWHQYISDISLTIYAKNLPMHYSTRYFKSSDTTDLSIENIDAYKTWHEDR